MVSKIRSAFSDNRGFLAASSAYIAAHVIDYTLTSSGVAGNALNEGNPVIRGYMGYFGVKYGLLICKALICSGVILGMKALDLRAKKRKTGFKPHYILYGGAVLTLLGGMLWLYQPILLP